MRALARRCRTHTRACARAGNAGAVCPMCRRALAIGLHDQLYSLAIDSASSLTI